MSKLSKYNSVKLCKGNLCLEAKGELAQAITFAVISGILLYALASLIQSTK